MSSLSMVRQCVRQVNAEQDQLLKSAFSLLDFDGDGKLGEDEFRTLLRYVVYITNLTLDFTY